MFGWNWMNGSWAWWLLIISALAWVVAGSTGCTIGSWDAQATDGSHKTTWNHGLEISVTGWGIYIGPGRNSVTTVEHEFEATAKGTGTDDVPPEETDDGQAAKAD